ncbi:unnamed protein product [Triticum turgidum subsp. durum]|uniref:Cytochrome b561 domain-containing protein n=1 Tax=Triticum turgidum subsp. durum TaxID=4567 RepID=A0A9R0QUP7_TRITD|nr:unnamed protein product [Triticum turgidum subsp. durum]
MQVHPVLMLIGFIIIGSEAIMSYKTLPWSHDTNKTVHLILHAVALFLGSFGVYAAFKFHNESGIANLYSLHSWVGLGTIILYGLQDTSQLMEDLRAIHTKISQTGSVSLNHLLTRLIPISDIGVSIMQWVSGFLTFFFPGASPTLRRAVLPWHVRAGLVVYVLALLAAELGFLEKLTFLQATGLGKYSSEALLVNFTALVVLLLGASVVLYVTAPAQSEHRLGYSSVRKS